MVKRLRALASGTHLLVAAENGCALQLEGCGGKSCLIAH